MWWRLSVTPFRKLRVIGAAIAALVFVIWVALARGGDLDFASDTPIGAAVGRSLGFIAEHPLGPPVVLVILFAALYVMVTWNLYDIVKEHYPILLIDDRRERRRVNPDEYAVVDLIGAGAAPNSSRLETSVTNRLEPHPRDESDGPKIKGIKFQTPPDSRFIRPGDCPCAVPLPLPFLRRIAMTLRLRGRPRPQIAVHAIERRRVFLEGLYLPGGRTPYAEVKIDCYYEPESQDDLPIRPAALPMQ